MKKKSPLTPLRKCPQVNDYLYFLARLVSTHEGVFVCIGSAHSLRPSLQTVGINLRKLSLPWTVHLSLLQHYVLLIALLFFVVVAIPTPPKLLGSFMIQNRTLVLLYIENGSLNFIMASNYFTFACVIHYYFIAV